MPRSTVRAACRGHDRLDRIDAFLPDSYAGSLRKSALASSFLAALELARQGRVTLRQEDAFAPLYLRGGAA